MKSLLTLAALVVAASPAAALELPTLSLRYETALGAEEDAPEEGLLPEYVRHTWLATGRQELGEAAQLDLEVRYTARENVFGIGDTSSIRVTPRFDVDVTPDLDLAAEVDGERVVYPEDRTRDYTAVGTRLEAAIDLGDIALDAWVRPVFDLHDAQLDRDRQVYTASFGLQADGESLRLITRYRGTLRLPLGDASLIERRATHTASVSLRWDLEEWRRRRGL